MQSIRVRSVVTPVGVVLAIVVVGLAATQVRAQHDHLQCHKVKDANKFKAAIVSLTVEQAAFQMPDDCSIKGKARRFCVPAEKNVVDPGDAPVPAGLPLSTDAAGDYVCYKMKCPKASIADTLVTDQFGERNLANVKSAQEICVPAVKGPAPFCGDDFVNAVGEECDGSDDSACLASCNPDCTCAVSCDPLAPACAAGEGCYLLEVNPVSPDAVCLTAGSGQQNDPCGVPSDCAPGLSCIGPGSPVCLTLCEVPSGTCPPATNCNSLGFGGAGSVGACS